MRTLLVVVPEGIDDPARPSGGNVYARRMCGGLAEMGWSVREREVAGDWPRPDARALAGLAAALADAADGGLVIIDGLIASAAAEVLRTHAARLRLVVLMHMPLGDGAPRARTAEGAALSVAAAVVATSGWTRRRLLELYPLEPGRVHVARPGVDAAALAPGSAGGETLLCVAAVTRGKGHDTLLDALATAPDLSWRCVCVGSLDRDPGFVEHLRRRTRDLGLIDRITFRGPRTGADLARHYAEADLLVLASRGETYGMVLAEALAHGVPVLATLVGGVAEAVGHGAGGTRPGLLVPPGDAAALGTAVRRWLCDAPLRGRLRHAARERRVTLEGWPATASVIDGVLDGVRR